MKKSIITLIVWYIAIILMEKIDDFENVDKRRIAVGLPPWQLRKDILELIKKKYGI